MPTSRPVTDQTEIRGLLRELADDEAAGASRILVCETTGQALARLGNVLWAAGYIIGPDRVSGDSPFRFGDDRAVGVATVAQIGGELATGAVDLLKATNRYAACAPIRQLVEVEYLATAFAEEHEIAAVWLRADRDERLKFWSPARLRQRAKGRFLNADYWHHCEMGGHPATPGMQLLPGHEGMHMAYLWTDLAGHLAGIWRAVVQSTERLLGGPLPTEWELPDVESAIERWDASDGFSTAMRDLGAILREDPNASAHPPANPAGNDPPS